MLRDIEMKKNTVKVTERFPLTAAKPRCEVCDDVDPIMFEKVGVELIAEEGTRILGLAFRCPGCGKDRLARYNFMETEDL